MAAVAALAAEGQALGLVEPGQGALGRPAMPPQRGRAPGALARDAGVDAAAVQVGAATSCSRRRKWPWASSTGWPRAAGGVPVAAAMQASRVSRGPRSASQVWALPSSCTGIPACGERARRRRQLPPHHLAHHRDPPRPLRVHRPCLPVRHSPHGGRIAGRQHPTLAPRTGAPTTAGTRSGPRSAHTRALAAAQRRSRPSPVRPGPPQRALPRGPPRTELNRTPMRYRHVAMQDERRCSRMWPPFPRPPVAD